MYSNFPSLLRQISFFTYILTAATKTHTTQPLSVELNDFFLKNLKKKTEKWRATTQHLIDTIDFFRNEDQKYRRVLVDSIDPYFDEGSKERMAYEKKLGVTIQ